MTMQAWPYPPMVAHRGAGRLAPENTLAAFRLGASHGYRMFECDVKLSADEVPFLLHDATLQRTTNGAGVAGSMPWPALAQLDAGSWHSRAFAGEPPASLAAVARFCLVNGYALNIEVKPTPGLEWRTGQRVAAAATELWPNGVTPPLFSSFQAEALAAVAEQAGQHSRLLPRGLLLDTLWPGWEDAVRQLGCVAVICNYALYDAELVRQIHALGCRCMAYTVNDEWALESLQALGLAGLITDRLDLFSASRASTATGNLPAPAPGWHS